MKTRHFLLILISWLSSYHCALAMDDKTYVTSKNTRGNFPLSVAGKPASIYIDKEDYPGVMIAAKNLQSDLKMVTGSAPLLFNTALSKPKTLIIIGTLGKSPEIDRLVKTKKLNVSGIAGKWETFLIQTIDHPFPGVDQALVIAGSDKRGTIFGIYDLSSNIGVSPWYWWADVPVTSKKDLYILPGNHSQGEPAVKYRGIFLNDEAPALSGWSKEKFGGFNSTFYSHVFELILRLKGNYLWPAMWGSAFYDDDPMNAQLADEYGVVIGTSHHEPLMRAHDEWRRYGKGDWNYSTNANVLQKFWTEGISRMGKNESIVTVGMRGDGDKPMSENSNISLLENIVHDQRKIITDITGKDASKTPQLWALYKEVQDYYDNGMRVPDDITLLLCDDNWGNIRKLPKLTEQPRSGGYGLYYHFDYVGGPRNYKWLNTNPLPRIWEQMNLAYEYNVRQIWIVNVGDLKPMEFPIEFFLDYAWSPKKWTSDRLEAYAILWAEKQFGKEQASAIASVLSRYGKYSALRKPELLDEHTYSLTNYMEFENIVHNWEKLKSDAEMINTKIPTNAKDAYYQLVLHPILAFGNLNKLYYAVAKNRLYASQGRSATHQMAEEAKALFNNDATITKYYNTEMAKGKWDHMMDQTHIGYTGWQQPGANKIPETKETKLNEEAEMGVAIEGSSLWWPQATIAAELPGLYCEGNKTTYIEIFNRGKKPFKYKIASGQPWLHVQKPEGEVLKEGRILLSVDFSKAPTGNSKIPITIKSDKGETVTVFAAVNNHYLNQPGFIEENGYISIEAEHFTKSIPSKEMSWKVLPDHGRTLSAVAPYPVTAKTQELNAQSAQLEYAVNLLQAGEIKINVYLSPTLDFSGSDGLFYGVSIDNEKPQLININTIKGRSWDTNVSENINILSSRHEINRPGAHTLKLWAISPGVVVQKLVIETKPIPATYLGPPESPRHP